MKSLNHVAGGVVFTSFCSAFHEVNLLEDVAYIPAVVVFSLLADIDHPRAIISFPFKKFSKFILKRYGHRTITHSVFACLFVYIISLFLEDFFQIDNLSLVCSYAFISHSFFDMMTKQGIQFLYPVSDIVFVIPANERFRFSSSSRTESMLLILFLVLSSFTLNFNKKGFWQSYNQTFATIKHLHSEFHKSKNFMKCKVNYRVGSSVDSIENYVVACTENSIVFLDDRNRFKLFEEDEKTVITKVEFQRTDSVYQVRELEMISSFDSLKQFLNDNRVLKLDVVCDDNYSFSDEYLTKQELRMMKKKVIVRDDFEERKTLLKIRNEKRKISKQINKEIAKRERQSLIQNIEIDKTIIVDSSKLYDLYSDLEALKNVKYEQHIECHSQILFIFDSAN